MWDEIDTIRNTICGYAPAPVATDAAERARLASKLAMRRLYARRRAEGPNAHGRPLAVPSRANITLRENSRKFFTKIPEWMKDEIRACEAGRMPESHMALGVGE